MRGRVGGSDRSPDSLVRLCSFEDVHRAESLWRGCGESMSPGFDLNGVVRLAAVVGLASAEWWGGRGAMPIGGSERPATRAVLALRIRGSHARPTPCRRPSSDRRSRLASSGGARPWRDGRCDCRGVRMVEVLAEARPQSVRARADRDARRLRRHRQSRSARQLLREWRATAEIHADPRLARRLRASIDAAGAPVAVPVG